MERLSYKTITSEHLSELAISYVETFNAEPWNDQWSVDSATKRLRQMICMEEFYGLCAYQDKVLCGAVIGCFEQFYNGVEFNIREFWVQNKKRGKGIGTQILSEIENRLKLKSVSKITLLTSRGNYTEHFYLKQGFISASNMVFMVKPI